MSEQELVVAFRDLQVPFEMLFIRADTLRRDKYGHYTHLDCGNPRWENSKWGSVPYDWQAPSAENPSHI